MNTNDPGVLAQRINLNPLCISGIIVLCSSEEWKFSSK